MKPTRVTKTRVIRPTVSLQLGAETMLAEHAGLQLARAFAAHVWTRRRQRPCAIAVDAALPPRQTRSNPDRQYLRDMPTRLPAMTKQDNFDPLLPSRWQLRS